MRKPNRYLILSLLLVIQMMIGGHYAWSIFSGELIAKHGFTAALSQVAYSVYHICFALAFLFGGRVLEKFGPRFTVLAGGAIFGLGYFLAGVFPLSVYSLALCLGVLGGTGSGFCYITPIATAQKWFEDKRAVATGATVAFFAFGAVLISFTAERLLSQGLALPAIFRILGIVYFVVIILCALFLKNPAGYKSHDEPMPLAAIIKDRNIIAMTVTMFAGLFAGLMVISSLKNIGVSRNIELAGFAVMFISAFNGAGRLLWGWIIQKIGEELSITISFAAQALVLFTSIYWVSGLTTFFIFAGLVGLMYACTLVAFASNVSRLYGVKHLTTIYGYMFLTNGAAGLSGPIIAGLSKDLTGSYDAAIITAAVVCAASLAVFKGMYREVKSVHNVTNVLNVCNVNRNRYRSPPGELRYKRYKLYSAMPDEVWHD